MLYIKILKPRSSEVEVNEILSDTNIHTEGIYLKEA